MNRTIKWFFVSIFVLLVTGCMMFMIVNLNALSKGSPPPAGAGVGEDLATANQEIVEKLQQAPWQGLRYMREEQTWRFFGVTGETKEIEIIQPVGLIKVFYLGQGGELNFTWVTTEIRFHGKPIYRLAPETLQDDQLVAVQLQGEYVNPSGVYWENCDLEYCRIAQMIDTRLVLDDKGTGISNGFIRNGWTPPTYPLYGFLCWQIVIVEEHSLDLLSGIRG